MTVGEGWNEGRVVVFQAEDGIRDLVRSRGLGDVYKRQVVNGVDVAGLVDAELNRRFPGRELRRAQTPDGLRLSLIHI